MREKGVELIDRVVAEARRGTRCGAKTRSGLPCRAYVALGTSDGWDDELAGGPFGWRCRHHGGVGSLARRGEAARRKRAADQVVAEAADALRKSLRTARGRRKVDLSVAVLCLAFNVDPATVCADVA